MNVRIAFSYTHIVFNSTHLVFNCFHIVFSCAHIVFNCIHMNIYKKRVFRFLLSEISFRILNLPRTQTLSKQPFLIETSQCDILSIILCILQGFNATVIHKKKCYKSFITRNKRFANQESCPMSRKKLCLETVAKTLLFLILQSLLHIFFCQERKIF